VYNVGGMDILKASQYLVDNKLNMIIAKLLIRFDYFPEIRLHEWSYDVSNVKRLVFTNH